MLKENPKRGQKVRLIETDYANTTIGNEYEVMGEDSDNGNSWFIDDKQEIAFIDDASYYCYELVNNVKKHTIIGGGRGCGKTTEMIKTAHKEDLYIVCSSRQRVKHIADLARKMELNIRFPISVGELPLRSPYIKRVLVDDLEDVLASLIGKPVFAASTSLEMKKVRTIKGIFY